MMHSQKGQAAIEFILISTVIVITAFAVMQGIRERNIIADLINSPFERLKVMVENGVWENPRSEQNIHPNYLRRSVSQKGEE